jgi:type II secretion system protein N
VSSTRASAAPRQRPRPFRIAAVVALGLLLTATFAYLRFPYDRLAASLGARLEEAGIELEIGSLAASPSLAGPGLAAENVRITRPDGSVLRLDRLRVRPAWSLAWLMARPALHLSAAAPQGELEGVAVLWGPQRFTGSLREVDLAELLDAEQLPGVQLEGRASFDLDVALEEDGPTGPVHISAHDGVLSHPQLPMAVPYQTLEGDLVLGGENWLEISAFELDSPLGKGSLRGTVGRGPDPAAAPLDLELALQVAPGIRGSLTSQGVRVGRDGELSYKIRGTAAAPVVN